MDHFVSSNVLCEGSLINNLLCEDEKHNLIKSLASFSLIGIFKKAFVYFCNINDLFSLENHYAVLRVVLVALICNDKLTLSGGSDYL